MDSAEKGVYYFKKKWEVDKSLKDLEYIAEKPGNYNTLGIALHIVKAYIGILETEINSYYRKDQKDGFCI